MAAVVALVVNVATDVKVPEDVSASAIDPISRTIPEPVRPVTELRLVAALVAELLALVAEFAELVADDAAFVAELAAAVAELAALVAEVAAALALDAADSVEPKVVSI